MKISIQLLIIFIACSLQLCAGAEIHSAINSGDPEKVAAVINKDSASINQADESGKTPLHLAVEKNDARLVSLLLSKGADSRIKDRSGRTPLRIATDAESIGCVKILVAKTATGYIDPLLDVRLKEGQEALKDGTLARVNEILGRLVRLDPASEGINFAYGLSWLSLGDPAPAGAAFDRVLNINPKNDRTRVELARARIMAKRFPEAKKELKKVLTSSLPSAVRQSVQGYLDEINRGINKWYYSGNVTIAGIYDSNVNIGPDSDIISISPVSIFGTTIRELNVSDSSKPADTVGLSVSASARALYDLGEPKGWLMATDADLYKNILKESDFETTSVQAGIGPKLMLDRGFIQLPFRTRYLEYGGDSLAWIYGLYPFFAYAPADMTGISFITTVTGELRDFDTLTARDGVYFSLSEIVRKSFAGGKYNIYGGAEIMHDHTDSAVYEYNGAGLIAGADARLPWKLNAFGEARYYYKNYREKDVLAPEDREDNQFMLALGLSKDISDRFTVALTENIINNDSSFDLYEYERYVTTLSTSWRF
ncbi:MAG: hypothetical protein A2283_16755 [Lentisphaerae bacterium RIFOXYA12_FULL_48_11]|nr:MAG: hypothetical protein A2283_16755 [Lentisphaerae bacterium RIFOXYA12_FULL_48_11]